MTEHFFGQLKAESHKHDGPINRVETENILAYDMSVGRPVLIEQLGAAVGVVAEGGNIV